MKLLNIFLILVVTNLNCLESLSLTNKRSLFQEADNKVVAFNPKDINDTQTINNFFSLAGGLEEIKFGILKAHTKERAKSSSSPVHGHATLDPLSKSGSRLPLFFLTKIYLREANDEEIEKIKTALSKKEAVFSNTTSYEVDEFLKN